MIKITFDRNVSNALIVGDDTYFLLEQKGRPSIMCNARCAHRGGPLHLGRACGDTGAITCPWHELTWPRLVLERSGLPTVRVGDRINTVVDATDELLIRMHHYERIIANE